MFWVETGSRFGLLSGPIMHFPEGLLSIQYAFVWTALAALFLMDSFWQTRKHFQNSDSSQKALLAVSAVFIFAVSFIPLPIPLMGGLCLHICATPFIALLIGPRLVVLPTFVSLVAQVFLLGHGGLTTLGASLMSFGVIAPWIAFLLVRVLLWFRLSAFLAVALSVGVGVLVASVLDAGLLTVSVYGWVAAAHWFPKILSGLMSLRLPLAVVEAFMSALLVRGIFNRRSQLLPDYIRLKLKPQVS